MKNIFKNRHGQLRSGWKILLVLGLSYGMAFIIAILWGSAATIISLVLNKGIYSKALMLWILKNPLVLLVRRILETLCMLLAVILLWQGMDKRPLKDLGLTSLRLQFKKLSRGFLLGALFMTTIFFILLGLNQIRLEDGWFNPVSIPGLLGDLVLFCCVGVSEELFSRGYCLKVLRQTGKTWVAVLGSSLIFAVLHLLNPHVNWFAVINIFLSGLFLAAMFLKTGNLWMPIGFHAAWNFFQGSVLGMHVSGLHVEGLIKIKTVGTSLVTGGAFGPEGGAVVTFVLCAGTLYFLKDYRRSQALISSERLLNLNENDDSSE